MSGGLPGPETINLVEGVGGRLARPKSESYRNAVSAIEQRATPYAARYMAASDLAFVLSAVECGLVSPDDGRRLAGCLLELLPDGGPLAAARSAVDLVTLREAWVISRVGESIGQQLHLGRNRAESLKGYLPRLFFRELLARHRTAVTGLVEALVDQAGRHRDTLSPVYHHLQHASVTTLAEYLLSWAENLTAHVDRAREVDARLAVAPPVNSSRAELRQLGGGVWRRLGFAGAQRLRHQQHATEDQFAEPLACLALTNVATARMCEDLRIWMSTEFGFFEPDDSHASGSSALPQKKNPFGLQAVIGGAAVTAGRLAGQLATSISLSDGLDSAFQAGSLYEQATDVVHYTEFVRDLVRDGRFAAPEMRAKAFLGYAMASELSDVLVYEERVPLRQVHHQLGRLIRALGAGEPPPDVAASLAASLGRPLSISNDDIVALLGTTTVPATALARDAVETVLADMRAWLARQHERQPDDDQAGSAIRALEAEARAFIAAPPEPR